MTLDEAIKAVQGVQADLDAGRIRPPYPTDVRRLLQRCLAVFTNGSPTAEDAVKIVRRLDGHVEALELPW